MYTVWKLTIFLHLRFYVKSNILHTKMATIDFLYKDKSWTKFWVPEFFFKISTLCLIRTNASTSVKKCHISLWYFPWNGILWKSSKPNFKPDDFNFCKHRLPLLFFLCQCIANFPSKRNFRDDVMKFLFQKRPHSISQH